MAVNIGAMLLVLISFVALGNIILSGVTGDRPAFELILGILFAPLAWHRLTLVRGGLAQS